MEKQDRTSRRIKAVNGKPNSGKLLTDSIH